MTDNNNDFIPTENPSDNNTSTENTFYNSTSIPAENISDNSTPTPIEDFPQDAIDYSDNILNCFDDSQQVYQPQQAEPANQNVVEYRPIVNSNYPYMSAQPKKKSKPKSKWIPFAAVVVSLSFVFSMLGSIAGNYISGGDGKNPITNVQEKSSDKDKDTSSTSNPILKTSNKSGSPLSVEEVVKLAGNSVVEITTEGMTTNDRMQQYVSTGAGSGVILSQDGYIVTNNHVIADAGKITVTLKDSTKYQATLIGTDPKTDIAVIKINAKGLTVAAIGKSSSLNVGQQTIVIGNPLGQLGGTVTDGIISALDREITIDGETMNLLQTNAAINPGNSGGGMFNNQGELIGVINAKSSGSDVEGLGFAIPMDTAKPVIEDLMKFGYVQGRINLGATLIDIEDELTAMMYRVNKIGVYVMKTDQTSNAAKAGLQPGDRITAVNKTAVKTSSDITAVIDKSSVGDTITMTIERNTRKGDIEFILQEDKGNNMAI